MGDEGFGGLPGDNYVTQAMSSFGQGISVTQTQMLRAFSAIANDGEMLGLNLSVRSTTQAWNCS